MFIKHLLTLLLLVATLTLGVTQADAKDCSNITTQQQLADCPDSLKDNAIMGQYSQLILTEGSANIANMVLRSLYNDDVDRFIYNKDAPTNQLVTAVMQNLQSFHGIAFAIMAVLVLPFYLNKIANKGELPGNNWGFFLMNFSVIMVSVGMGGVLMLFSAAMLVGLYNTNVMMLEIHPLFYKSTRLDASHTFTHTKSVLAKSTPQLINDMVNANRRILQAKIGAYSGFSIERVGDKFIEKAVSSQDVTIDNMNITRIYNGFADCISQKVDGVRFHDFQFVNPEFEKIEKCMHMAGIKSYELPVVAYGGDNKTVQAAIVAAWNESRVIAQLLIEATCNTILNKNDNRARLADDQTIYNQCAAMDETGAVKKEGNVVQLYNSSKSLSEISSLYKSAVNNFNNSLGSYTKELQAIEAEKNTFDESAPSDMISAAISTLQAKYVGDSDVTTKAVEDIQTIVVASDIDSNMPAAISRIINSTSRQDEEFNTNFTRKQLVDFDKQFDNYIVSNAYSESTTSKYGLLAADFLTSNFFEHSGQNFKDCFQKDAACVTPMLNQASAQYQNGQKMLAVATKFYLSVEVVKAFVQQTSTTAMRQKDFMKSAKLNSNVRQLSEVSSVVKNMIWFYMIVMIFQSSLLYMAFVYHLFHWIYNFWTNYIALYKEMAANLLPASDETEKTNILFSIFKKIAWIALAPSFAAFLFFVNSAIYSLLLTLVNSGVYFIVDGQGIGDYGVFNGVLIVLVYLFITVIVVTGLLAVIILKTNKLFVVVENWFEVQHSSSAAYAAVEAGKKAESTIGARL